MKPVSYTDNQACVLLEVEQVIEDLPADWHGDAAIEGLTSASAEDHIAALQLLEALEQHQLGFMTKEQLREYL
jgi:hypothetical protein